MRIHTCSSLFLIPALLGLTTASRADILYVSNFDNGTIEKFNSLGSGSLFANSGSALTGLAFDSAGISMRQAKTTIRSRSLRRWALARFSPTLV
jgi:hypothetical protein